MKTLIELYDERAIENVIGPETFLPKKVVYLCPAEIVEDRYAYRKLLHYFQYRHLSIAIEFVECSLYKTDKIVEQLWSIFHANSDCALDVTGGTDAALFAAGVFCHESGIPTFTYSRKRNSFYNISNADFADNLICKLEYKVEDYFHMTGGSLREGRVDNHILGSYLSRIDQFFEIFLKHRRSWVDDITFFQKISKGDDSSNGSLNVSGNYVQKGEHGSRVHANPGLLHDLCELGFIKNLHINEKTSLSFTFMDSWTRTWLRDVGSVLELYMYKACIDTEIFGDVISSAVVDWDGYVGHDSVSNEIDVVASRGCIPIFISCKACEVRTSAINELAILRDRFGGKGAKAVIVTSEKCNAAARHRSAQLGIAVIDLEELEKRKAADRIRIIMKMKSGDEE